MTHIHVGTHLPRGSTVVACCMMLYNALAIILVSSAMAVEDPAAGLNKDKDTKSFLKNLGDLKGAQIEALGSINQEICAAIQSTHVTDNDKLQDRLRRRLNMNCAAAIQKHHPSAFSEIFYDSSKGEKMEFVRRMGGQICDKADLFKGSPISRQVEKYCAQDKSKQAAAKRAQPQVECGAASALQASLVAACGAALVSLLI